MDSDEPMDTDEPWPPGYPCHPSGHRVGMTGRLRGQLVIMMEPTEERERDDLATNTRNQA